MVASAGGVRQRRLTSETTRVSKDFAARRAASRLRLHCSPDDARAACASRFEARASSGCSAHLQRAAQPSCGGPFSVSWMAAITHWTPSNDAAGSWARSQPVVGRVVLVVLEVDVVVVVTAAGQTTFAMSVPIDAPL